MRRRGWVIGFGWFAWASAAVAAEDKPPRRRRPEARPARPASRAAPPAIDPAPAPARAGSEPAPTPARDPQPPAADRAVRPSVDFGVPAPREPQTGQTLRAGDPSLEARGGAAQSGARVPAPGATVRVPF